MKLALIFLQVVICSFSFSQKTVKLKNDVKIEFESLIKDTIFSGYQNIIYIKGISDFAGITIEGKNSTITVDKTNNEKFIVIPLATAKEDYIVIKKNGKEIKKQKVIIAVMTKDTAKRLKNRTVIK